MLHEEFEEIPCQEGHIDVGIIGRTLAWAGAFSALLDKIVGHDRASLRGKAKELKKMDGEGWVAGELLESICIYADAIDAQFGRVRIAGPLPDREEDVVVKDEMAQKAVALDCLLATLKGHDRPSLRAKAQAHGTCPSPEESLISKIVSGLCSISWAMEKGGTGSLDDGMTWFRFDGPDAPVIRCDCETCEEEAARRVGPCAPQGDSGSGSI